MHPLHLEILPASQRSLWQQFSKDPTFFRTNNLYLAGGTALALHTGHRLSLDFDFFSQNQDLAAVVEPWLQSYQAVIREQDAHTIHAEISNVEISFIGAYKYGLVEPVIGGTDIPLASITDIGLMKLLAITSRATVRDYIDLALIIRDYVPLKTLLSAAPQKYGKGYNIMIPVKALVSFDDLDPEMPEILNQSLAKDWQDILKQAVRAL